MSKIQTVFGLLLLILIVFSMDLIFDNPLRETFSGFKRTSAIGRGTGISGVGHDLSYKPPVKNSTLYGNMVYSGVGFLGSTKPQNIFVTDDQPLFFGFKM